VGSAGTASYLPDGWMSAGLAFVVFRPGREPAPGELAGYRRARLVAFKVPGSYRVMAELPRLSSGNIDKRALSRGQPGTP
jgi:fatty-acyl-CoA synthase